jgi:hypothetical protein
MKVLPGEHYLIDGKLLSASEFVNALGTYFASVGGSPVITNHVIPCVDIKHEVNIGEVKRKLKLERD